MMAMISANCGAEVCCRGDRESTAGNICAAKVRPQQAHHPLLDQSSASLEMRSSFGMS